MFKIKYLQKVSRAIAGKNIIHKRIDTL